MCTFSPSSPVSASSLVSSVPKTRGPAAPLPLPPPPPLPPPFPGRGLIKLRKKATNLPLFRFQTGIWWDSWWSCRHHTPVHTRHQPAIPANVLSARVLHIASGLQGDVVYIYLSWPIAPLLYESKCGGNEGGGGCGVSASPNKLWRSTSIFNLCT